MLQSSLFSLHTGQPFEIQDTSHLHNAARVSCYRGNFKVSSGLLFQNVSCSHRIFHLFSFRISHLVDNSLPLISITNLPNTTEQTETFFFFHHPQLSQGSSDFSIFHNNAFSAAAVFFLILEGFSQISEALFLLTAGLSSHNSQQKHLLVSGKAHA